MKHAITTEHIYGAYIQRRAIKTLRNSLDIWQRAFCGHTTVKIETNKASLTASTCIDARRTPTVHLSESIVGTFGCNKRSQSNLERAASLTRHITPSDFRQNCPLPTGDHLDIPHLIHRSVGRPDPPPQTAARSPQPFLHNTRSLPTDGPTELNSFQEASIPRRRHGYRHRHPREDRRENVAVSACHRNNFNRACRTCRRGSSRGSRCRRRGMRALRYIFQSDAAE